MKSKRRNNDGGPLHWLVVMEETGLDLLSNEQLRIAAEAAVTKGNPYIVARIAQSHERICAEDLQIISQFVADFLGEDYVYVKN